MRLLQAIQQNLAAGAGVVLFEYFQRIDLSRPFLGLFVLSALVAPILFRMAGGVWPPAF